MRVNGQQLDGRLVQEWSFTSTGVGATLEITSGNYGHWRWYFESVGSSRSTSTIQVDSAWASSGPWVSAIASISLSSGAHSTASALEGPYLYLRPYCTSLGSTTSSAAVLRVGVVGGP